MKDFGNSTLQAACCKRRILMLLENESYPDDSRVALECRSLREAGFEIRVICPTGVSKRRYENVAGVHVYRYPQMWDSRGFLGYIAEYSYSLAMFLFISAYILLRHGFDAIHVHAPPDISALIGCVYKLCGKRFVLDQHDLSPELYLARKQGNGSKRVERALRWFERFACGKADRLIATNETQRRTQIARGGADPEKCLIVRNGPDDCFLQPVEPLPELRNGREIIIGYVGMIGLQDGVDYLLRAVAHLQQKMGRENIRTVVVGSGPALRDLKQLAEDLQIANAVEFAGYRIGRDLLKHIASFDICVTPDPTNAYNDSCTTVKTMEYMAMGKPVVAFDLPENRVTLGDAGLYATGNDPRSLAAQIARLIDEPEMRLELGSRGRERIERHFTWQLQKGALLLLYQDLFATDLQCIPASAPRQRDLPPVANFEHASTAHDGCVSATRHEHVRASSC